MKWKKHDIILHENCISIQNKIILIEIELLVKLLVYENNLRLNY